MNNAYRTRLAKGEFSMAIETRKKHAIRFPPCPVYDIEGTESWLESMAEQGLFLQNFFAGFAVFEKGNAQPVRYRLQAAPKSTSMWSDSSGEPEQEAVEFSKTYGWEYLCKRWEFYVYCCRIPNARELDTDPQVQALALDLVRKRERGNFISSLFWLIIYPVLFLFHQPLLTIIGIGTGLFLLGAVLAIWGLCSSLFSYFHLRKLRRRLKKGIPLNHKKDWKRWARFYRLEFPCFLVVFSIWLACIFSGGYREYTGADEIPLQDYAKPLPFATLEDFNPDGQFSYDDSLGLSNKITVKSDPLAPVSIRLLQDGQILLSDGTFLDGGLSIEYYRAATPFLAREIFRELFTRDQNAKNYEPLPFSLPDVEEVSAYSSIFPTILLRKDEEVLCVSFYQASENAPIPIEEWARVFADSLQG